MKKKFFITKVIEAIDRERTATFRLFAEKCKLYTDIKHDAVHQKANE